MATPPAGTVTPPRGGTGLKGDTVTGGDMDRDLDKTERDNIET